MMYFGETTYPNADRLWGMIQKHKATFLDCTYSVRSSIKASSNDEAAHPKSGI
jgi:acyl-coenzyme A synthetase/AMP-(fatty) acid ligase